VLSLRVAASETQERMNGGLELPPLTSTSSRHSSAIFARRSDLEGSSDEEGPTFPPPLQVVLPVTRHLARDPRSQRDHYSVTTVQTVPELEEEG
jgi:hypothetical protein